MEQVSIYGICMEDMKNGNGDFDFLDYQHHSRSHLNQGHENVDQKFKYYQQFDRRQRRQATGDEDPNERALNEALQCQSTRCAIIRCLAGPIGDKDVAFIGLRTRVVAHTLHKISSGSPINFSTMTVARVTRLPYIGQPKEMPLKTHEIQVVATPEPTPKPDVVPLWIVVLAACAGTIILLLLVYLLSKVSVDFRSGCIILVSLTVEMGACVYETNWLLRVTVISCQEGFDLLR